MQHDVHNFIMMLCSYNVVVRLHFEMLILERKSRIILVIIMMKQFSYLDQFLKMCSVELQLRHFLFDINIIIIIENNFLFIFIPTFISEFEFCISYIFLQIKENMYNIIISYHTYNILLRLASSSSHIFTLRHQNRIEENFVVFHAHYMYVIMPSRASALRIESPSFPRYHEEVSYFSKTRTTRIAGFRFWSQGSILSDRFILIRIEWGVLEHTFFCNPPTYLQSVIGISNIDYFGYHYFLFVVLMLWFKCGMVIHSHFLPHHSYQQHPPSPSPPATINLLLFWWRVVDVFFRFPRYLFLFFLKLFHIIGNRYLYI